MHRADQLGEADQRRDLNHITRLLVY